MVMIVESLLVDDNDLNDDVQDDDDVDGDVVVAKYVMDLSDCLLCGAADWMCDLLFNAPMVRIFVAAQLLFTTKKLWYIQISK